MNWRRPVPGSFERKPIEEPMKPRGNDQFPLPQGTKRLRNPTKMVIFGGSTSLLSEIHPFPTVLRVVFETPPTESSQIDFYVFLDLVSRITPSIIDWYQRDLDS